MSVKKNFLLRIDEHTMALLKRWADDDLRSLNGQIEFLLKRSLRETGRWKEAEILPAPPLDTTEE